MAQHRAGQRLYLRSEACQQLMPYSKCGLEHERMTVYEYRLSFLHHDNGVSSIATVGEFGWQSA